MGVRRRARIIELLTKWKAQNSYVRKGAAGHCKKCYIKIIGQGDNGSQMCASCWTTHRSAWRKQYRQDLPELTEEQRIERRNYQREYMRAYRARRAAGPAVKAA